jgi:hypothetical protein
MTIKFPIIPAPWPGSDAPQHGKVKFWLRCGACAGGGRGGVVVAVWKGEWGQRSGING